MDKTKNNKNLNRKKDTEFSIDNPVTVNDKLTDVSTLLKSSEKTMKSTFPKKRNS